MSRFDQKIDLWKSRLLDLSRRNRLLYFRPTKFSTVGIVSPSLVDLVDTLVVRERPMRFPLIVRSQAEEPLEVIDEDETLEQEQFRVQRGDLEVDVEPGDLTRRLYRLRRDFHTALTEQGVHTLFVALGLLKWRDSEASEDQSQAPLILAPVELTRDSDDKPYVLKLADEDVVVNPTLAYKLQNDFAISLPELPEDMDEFNVTSFLARISSRVSKLGWSVADEAWLGRFSFEKLVMYKDLEDHRDEAREHLVVAALGGESKLAQSDDGLSAAELDDLTNSPDAFPVLDTDSSQLETLVRVRSGEHLVVYGPPGTGKSQTISNIIAQALRDGKRVLFVSEKMAALEVVDRRLREVGLAPAILEVHSHRANKRAVIEELGRTLFRDRVGSLSHVESEFQSLRQTVGQLNDYVRELHRPRDERQRSAYQVIGRLANLDEAPYLDARLPWDPILEVSLQDELAAEAALRELAAVPTVVENYDDHPFNGWDVEELSLEKQNRIRGLLQGLFELVSRLQEEADQLAGAVGVDILGSLQRARWLADLGRHLSAAPEVRATWFDDPERMLRLLRRSIRELRARQEAHHTTKAELGSLSGVGIAELPIAELAERFSTTYRGRLRWFKSSYRRDMAMIRGSWTGPAPINYATVLRALELTASYNDDLSWLALSSEKLSKLFGDSLFKGFDTDCTAVEEAIDWAHALTQLVGSPVPIRLVEAMRDLEGLRQRASALLAPLTEDLEELTAPRVELDGLYPKGLVDDVPIDEAALGTVRNWLKDRMERLAELFDWARFLRARKQCEVLGLSDLVSRVLSTRLTVDQILPAFQKRLLIRWLAEAEGQSTALSGFSGTYRDEIIRSYRELDSQLLRVSARLTLAQVESMQPRPAATSGAASSQMSILLREIQKRRRHKPLRRLFAEIPQLLQTLKPCLLMSPLSVSSYLAKESFHFDLVVFDEASQIPPQDAICPILRADQVVVAGDDRQLPPTTFFQVDLDDDLDEGAIDEAPLESILDECAAVPTFGRSRLRWHYRSRHEGLIAFSNREFYDGELVTFPSPVAVDHSVKFEYVADAVYERGGSRTNRQEARRVAELVLEHFENYGASRSLGVIALSIAQERAIDDELIRARAGAPHLAPFFIEEGEEPFFVKNLENVQGDERDHIIISIGYGPDAAGQIGLNFGPINRSGGERRLNVAITRAKWQTMAVCSFYPHQLDLARLTTQNQGVIKLQRYLEYAHRGEFVPDTAIRGGPESEFEEAVGAALVRAGLKIDTQVGCSGFRIDLAIRHPDYDGRYVLGIECDGAQYHSCRTARDRDRLRQEVLERLGWNILRIWCPDWLRDRDRQITRVLQAVDEFRQRGDPGVPAPPPPRTDPPGDLPDDSSGSPDEGGNNPPFTDQAVQPIDLPPYKEYKAERIRPQNELYDAAAAGRARDRAVEELWRIVVAEGPIHKRATARRLAASYGLKRVGNKVQASVDQVISAAVCKKAVRAKGEFLWPIAERDIVPRRRIDGKEPPIEEVAIEEIVATMKIVLGAHFGMAPEDLATETAHALAYDRTGERVSQRMKEAIRHLLRDGEALKAGDQLVLPRSNSSTLAMTGRSNQGNVSAGGKELQVIPLLQWTAATWKRMANWGKETSRLNKRERVFSFEFGKILDRGARPSENQVRWAAKLQKRALEAGFEPMTPESRV